jgi:hypothetical protein
MIAIPPMVIHGARERCRHSVGAMSAASSGLLARFFRTLLDASPTAPHLLHTELTHWVPFG